MGAIQDRLEISLQDVKQWLKLPLTYTSVDVTIRSDVEANSTIKVNVVDKVYVVGTGATPDPATIATNLVAEIIGDPPTGITATDEGGGVYRVKSTADPMVAFSAYFSRGQDIAPAFTVEDQLLVSILTVALIMADDYCNNPFAEVDDDGVVVDGSEEDIPAPIRTGVLQLTDWLYRDYQSGGASSSGEVLGPVKAKRAGDLSITYATADEVYGRVMAGGSSLPSLVRAILDAYRFLPGWRYPREDRTVGPLTAMTEDDQGRGPSGCSGSGSGGSGSLYG